MAPKIPIHGALEKYSAGLPHQIVWEVLVYNAFCY